MAERTAAAQARLSCCPSRCLPPQFVDHHRATGADITIGCLPCDSTRASDFGLMKASSRLMGSPFRGEPVPSLPCSACLKGTSPCACHLPMAAHSPPSTSNAGCL